MKLIADTPACQLYCGDSWMYEGDADLVLTNPYGLIPVQLRSKPLILSHDAGRKAEMETFAGQALMEIGRWHRGMQAVWVANLEPKPIDLEFLAAEEFEPGRGWWPLDLPLRLLLHYGYDYRANPQTWEGTGRDNARPLVALDPFMGRGTTGKACQILGLDFVGIDIDPERVELAKRYLGVV
jgi:hypothetical protein